MPKIPFWVFILIACLYFTAARVDIMEGDAAQYAEMSREMTQSHDYLHFYDRGRDYLDKPPFLFWVSTASMEVFGINNFAYKLPSILFALLAIYATYRLAKLFYGENTGRMAALVLASCQGLFLMTNDIRCDTILMCWVTLSIWMLKEWDVSGKPKYFFTGCAAIAFGMMTKGPIALMVPVFCFVSDWALKREWKKFLKPVYISGILLIAILLIPMSIGLYQQFDMHPEKIIEGKQHTSGLRFFYWSQSFGRITGENPWKNGADISFLLVNMLWSFLPWIFLFLPAVVINCITLLKQKFRLQAHQEWITTGGFLLTYLALGSSQYQLPHYIFVVFPLAAVMTARLLKDFFEDRQYRKLYAFMQRFQVVIIALLFLACLLLLTYVFPSGVISIILWAVSFSIWLFIIIKKDLCGRMMWQSAIGVILINFFLTNYTYCYLLQYQLGSTVGRHIKEHNIAADKIIIFKPDDPVNAIDFYAQRVIKQKDTIQYIAGKDYVLTSAEGLEEIQHAGYKYNIEKQGVFFEVTRLTLPFVYPPTRSSEVKNYYFLRMR